MRKQNEEIINDLRKKNKQMAARLKALKTPAASGATEVEVLDLKIAEAVKKLNGAKHDVQRKQLENAGKFVFMNTN